MPPRLKPITAPSSAAINMVLGEAPPVPRYKRTEVYAMAKVQKVSRKYMRVTPGENCLTNTVANRRKFGPLNLVI
jgi:hypothetical protein